MFLAGGGPKIKSPDSDRRMPCSLTVKDELLALVHHNKHNKNSTVILSYGRVFSGVALCCRGIGFILFCFAECR